MAANIRCIMRAKAPYGQGITKMKVKLTPEQSSTPSLMPETNSVYLTRPTEGTGELMELVGGSVAWNQLVPDGTIMDTNHNPFAFSNGTQFVAGHKYLCRGDRNVGEGNMVIYLYHRPDGSSTNLSAELFRFTSDSQLSAQSVIELSFGGTANGQANAQGGFWMYCYFTPVPNTTLSNLEFIDLTQMFGSTIADYVYSLEQSTAGSGIARLRSYDFLTEDYYTYSAPTLQSVEATAHVIRGKNLMNPDWSAWTVGNLYAVLADVVPKGEVARITLEDNDTSVSLSGCNMGFVYEDTGSTATQYRWVIANGVVQSNVTNISVVDSATLCSNVFIYPKTEETLNKLLARYNIMVELGTNATDYTPYHAPTTYPFGTTTLRGMLKTDANGNLYYDGDTYEWDGTVTRKYYEIDLGAQNWAYYSSYAYFGISISTKSNGTPVFCSKYVYGGAKGDAAMTTADIGVYVGGASKEIKIKDTNYTDAASFKTAMSGVKLIFELATPTTESADPFTAVQTVEDGGTEEFVTTNGVPVGVVGRFANAVPMEGVDSFTVTANDGTVHTYPVTLSEEIYRGYVDMLTGEAVSEAASIAEYNGETISEPWLSSLDEYAAGTTPTNGAQVVYPITPEEVTATITGDPSELSGVVSATSTEGTVVWSELSEIGIKCIMKRKNPFQ